MGSAAGAMKPSLDALVVVTSNARRGAELEGIALATQLASRGLDTRAVALAPTDGPGQPIDIETLGPTPTSITTLRHLRGVAATAKLVIAYGSSTLPACAIGLLGASTPFVYRSIGDPVEWLRGPIHRARTGALFRRPAHVIALWPRAADDIARQFSVPADTISVIPNARSIDDFAPPSQQQRVHARRSWGIDDERPVIVSLGALSAEKRVDRAVRAMEFLPRAHLLIAGDGPEHGALERLVAESTTNVTLVGQVTDPRTVLHAADVLVLSSQTEGMPGVVIEAGLSAVPTVAPHVGAIPDMIDNGLTGIIAGGNSAAELGAALDQAVEDAQQLGKRALHRMRECYTWDAVAPSWLRLLETAACR